METIAALELVVGFPVLATVSAAQRGTLRIATGGNVYGLNLETGLRVAPEEPVVHAPPMDLVTTSLSGDRTAWVIDNVSYPFSKRLGALTVGNDDRLVSCTYDSISVYDRARFIIRTVRVPEPIDLRDRVTGGMQGNLDSRVVYVEPGFLVFVRTPALLVVALADVERALVFDDTVWSIQNILAVREPDKTLAARRGKWNGGRVTSATGTLDITTAREPILVCDLMWPPNGWAAVELADGSRVPAHERPREHRTANVDVVQVALSSALDRKTNTTWPVVHPPLPPQPPATHRDLRIIPQPTAKGAVAYAKEIRLDERHGSNGPLHDAVEQLKSYPRKSGKVLDWIARTICPAGQLAAATPYVLPALVALACDPKVPRRDELLDMIVDIARSARRSGDADVTYAFRLVLPLLLDLRNASPEHTAGRAWLVAFVAESERFPSWWHDAKKTIRDLATLDDELSRSR